jgi:hypothetical protein
MEKRRSKLLKQNKWKWYDGENSYHKKDKEIKDAMIRDAKGHICSECRNLQHDYCSRHESIDSGGPIKCSSHSPVCFVFFTEDCRLGESN